MKWQGQRFLVLSKGGCRKVSPRFHLFVSDVDQRNEGAEWVLEYLRGRRDGKTLLRSYASS